MVRVFSTKSHEITFGQDSIFQRAAYGIEKEVRLRNVTFVKSEDEKMYRQDDQN